MADRVRFRHAVPLAAPEYSDGRVVGRIVPFDVPMKVSDLTPQGIDTYLEGFRRGAFARQAGTAERGVLQRVRLVHEHVGGSGYLGALVDLEEREDGAWGEFAVMPSRREDALWLYDQGVREMSVEFDVLADHSRVKPAGDGVRWRTNTRLLGVAMLAQGAYGRMGAEVVAVRELDDEDDEPDETPSGEGGEPDPPADEANGDEGADDEDDEERERMERERQEAALARERRTREAFEWAEADAQRRSELAERFG